MTIEELSRVAQNQADRDTLRRVYDLAQNMASYAHHSGFPVYDGGHSEPEATCPNPDCVAVRRFTQLIAGAGTR